MIDLKSLEAWFVTGSQHLYGDEVLKEVAGHAETVSRALSGAAEIPLRIVCKPVVTTPDAIHALFRDANQAPHCVGVLAWMHTFSPAKMWIAGLRAARKPLVHLHTQFQREIPWKSIDMNFMNLNQSAHGGREFGFVCTRLRLPRAVVVGHWEDHRVRKQLGVWARSAAARHDAQGLRIARLGDNMREVAVTEGDKVEAQLRFGYAVNGYGLGDLACHVDAVSDGHVRGLIEEYEAQYDVAEPLWRGGGRRTALHDAARIELGLRQFLAEGNFGAFTDTFENLHGLKQLPGIAVQRLMADGYGFGAEGDWKTAALVRAMKVMSHGLDGGTSFMEDYTYHLQPTGGQVLGAHMLEICPSIARDRPSLEIHPLAIGGKEDPVRLVFDTSPGPALNAAILDLGGRFRLLVNDVNVVSPPEPLPRLPVARALWEPRPDFSTAAAAWILAGGPHHTSFTQALTADYLESFAEMSDVEFLHINDRTTLADFKNHLRWNQAYWHLVGGC